ncbi:MAG: hypothetical protein ACJAXA_002279 [Candidatus Aldehydirespiratoraceae bacterium]|jgi:hypothetical protein
MIGATAILVPAVALNLWVTVLAFDRVNPNDSAFPSFLTDEASSGVEDLVAWLATVFVSFVTAVVGYFAAQLLLGDRFGTPISLGRGLLATLRRIPAIFVVWLFTHWWFPLMALIVVTANSGSVFLWLFLFTFLSWFSSAATLPVIPAMAAEGLGPWAAVTRSWGLVKLRYGLCVVFVLAATVLSALLLVGIATLVPLLEATGFVQLGSADWVVQGVMVQLAVLVVVPLIALGTAQVYLELRLDGEGLDLMIDADAAFGPATGPMGLGGS